MHVRLERFEEEQIAAQGRLSSAASQCWCLVQGLKSFADLLAQLERTELTRTVQRLAKRRLAEALAWAFRTWGCQAGEAKRLRARARLVECKCARGAMRVVLRAVLRYAEEMRRLRRAASRIAAQQLAGYWGRWLSGVWETQRVRGRLRKAEGKRRPSWLARMFKTWRQHALEEERLRRIGGRIRFSARRRAALMGLVMWRAASECKVWDAVMSRRLCLRWERRQLRRAVVGWAEMSWVSSKMRLEVRRASEKRSRGSAWQALLRWAVATEHKRHKDRSDTARKLQLEQAPTPDRPKLQPEQALTPDRPKLQLEQALTTPDSPPDKAPKLCSSPLRVLKLRGVVRPSLHSPGPAQAPGPFAL